MNKLTPLIELSLDEAKANLILEEVSYQHMLSIYDKAFADLKVQERKRNKVRNLVDNLTKFSKV